MTPRRVRLSRIILEPYGRDPKPKPIALIECLRIASKCANRPDLWEWKLHHAVHVHHTEVRQGIA